MKIFTRFAVFVFAFALLAVPALAVDITIYPNPLVFSSAPLGYDNSAMWRDLSVNYGGPININEGDLQLTDKFELDPATTFPIVIPGTISVRPKLGLGMGPHEGTLTITLVNLPIVPLSFTVTPSGYSATIDPKSREWTAELGYVNSDRDFSITNTGTETITGLRAAMQSGADTVFTLFDLPETLAPGAKSTVFVRPKNGLGHGVYTDTLEITGDNGISLVAGLQFRAGILGVDEKGGCGSLNTGVGTLAALALLFGLSSRSGGLRSRKK